MTGTPLAFEKEAAAPTAGQPAWRAYSALCKLRVNSLIVFTALIGMGLAVPAGTPLPWLRIAVAGFGIGLVACGAAVFNCLIECRRDARMARTRQRPTVTGEVTAPAALVFGLLLAIAGTTLLAGLINGLTAGLALATFVGYTLVYTVFLKPATPLNIVIGGAAGAMPPVLGWTAMTGGIASEALVLFLIIFLWTPPHFWALACARRDDYARAGLPMLPVSHGLAFTCWHILLYTLMLAAASLIPVSLGMSGRPYLLAAVLLDLAFLGHAVALCERYSDRLALRTFRFSILYLAGIFAALFVDRLATPF